MRTNIRSIPTLFTSLRRAPENIVKKLRLATAIHRYERGMLSQERTARIAGLDRTDFLLALAGKRVGAFVVDMEDLKRELKR